MSPYRMMGEGIEHTTVLQVSNVRLHLGVRDIRLEDNNIP